LLAALRALLADFGALRADVRVMFGAAQHEIGAYGANLRAVHHQTKVVRLDVRAARFQTMPRQVHEARRVTLLAVVDAGLHFGVHLVHFSSPQVE